MLFWKWHFQLQILNENVWILNKTSLKSIPEDPIDDTINIGLV